MKSIYLDNNATTPLLPAVATELSECYAAGYANPASQHRLGQQARTLLEESREAIGRLLGARVGTMDADRVIFTSGGTEANNLALCGFAGTSPGRIIISAIEHPSIVGPAERWRQLGFDVRRLPVSRSGVVLVDALGELLTPDTRVVSVMLGNNETGVLQPIREIAARCAAAGVPLHTDAVQAVGKIPVNFRALSVAALSASAHKFHGPVGIGALIVRHGARIQPQLFGGFQQEGLRPGTEPLPLIVGFRKALQCWGEQSGERTAHLERLRETFESALRAEMPDVIINGRDAPRLPHTSNISFIGLDRQSLLLALDLAGVACSTGSACASGSSEPSPVLLAMGLPPAVVSSALRFSWGATTTVAEVQEAARRIVQVCRTVRRQHDT